MTHETMTRLASQPACTSPTETLERPSPLTQAERPVLHRRTRHEYEQLIDHGILDEDDPIELLDGLLLVKEPQHSPHRMAVLLVAKALERASSSTTGPGRSRTSASSEARRVTMSMRIRRGRRSSSRSRGRLRIARGRKAAAYARAGIADYWIVNLIDRVLEAHREPARPGPARRRWGYVAIATLGGDATITPLAAPSSGIRVADLLP